MNTIIGVRSTESPSATNDTIRGNVSKFRAVRQKATINNSDENLDSVFLSPDNTNLLDIKGDLLWDVPKLSDHKLPENSFQNASPSETASYYSGKNTLCLKIPVIPSTYVVSSDFDSNKDGNDSSVGSFVSRLDITLSSSIPGNNNLMVPSPLENLVTSGLSLPIQQPSVKTPLRERRFAGSPNFCKLSIETPPSFDQGLTETIVITEDKQIVPEPTINDDPEDNRECKTLSDKISPEASLSAEELVIKSAEVVLLPSKKTQFKTHATISIGKQVPEDHKINTKRQRQLSFTCRSSIRSIASYALAAMSMSPSDNENLKQSVEKKLQSSESGNETIDQSSPMIQSNVTGSLSRSGRSRSSTIGNIKSSSTSSTSSPYSRIIHRLGFGSNPTDVKSEDAKHRRIHDTGFVMWSVGFVCALHSLSLLNSTLFLASLRELLLRYL